MTEVGELFICLIDCSWNSCTVDSRLRGNDGTAGELFICLVIR